MAFKTGLTVIKQKHNTSSVNIKFSVQKVEHRLLILSRAKGIRKTIFSTSDFSPYRVIRDCEINLIPLRIIKPIMVWFIFMQATGSRDREAYI